MANQIYFPHYKEIFDADPAAFILISHPQTGLAYKIRVDALQEALSSSLVSTDTPNMITIGTDSLLLVSPTDMISADAANGLVLGSDDLLYSENLYNADGTISSNRTINLDGKTLTFSDGSTITINADTLISHIVADGSFTATNQSAADQILIVVKEDATSNSNVITVSDAQIALSTNPLGVENNVIELSDGTGIAIASVTDNISLTVTSGNAINLAIPAGAELQISGSAGNAESVLQSNGAGNPPSWKKIKYAHPFVIADWGAGTTLTITTATHGLGVGYHNVTVFDATHNIVPIAAVLTNVNVDGTSGDVVLTIVNNAAAFSGTMYMAL